MAEIPALEEDGIAVGAGTGVGQAVREVELRRVAPALPVSLERLHGDAADAVADRHDRDPGLGQELVKVSLNIGWIAIQAAREDHAGFQADHG